MTQENCCFRLTVNRGCLALGVVTFLFSTAICTTTITYMALEEEDHKFWSDKHAANLTTLTLPHHILNLNLSKPVIDTTLGIVLVASVLWMWFSLVLVFGIRRNNANCVMSYFLFGIVVSILFLLSGILELVHKMWELSLATFIVTSVYLYFLGTVYSAYDQMQKNVPEDQMRIILDESFGDDIGDD